MEKSDREVEEHVAAQTAGEESRPDPALKRLEKLVGTWDIKGRTPGAQEEDISGRVTIQWLPGGFFLEQRGEIKFQDTRIQSLEILYYNPETKAFSSTVYSNLGGLPATYFWDVQGDTVIHADEESQYTGTFSEDGNILSGGWRPKEGKESITYDAVMTRVG